ncbi:MAG: PilZ domain-containing protein [Acidobacteriota bacterium]|nr:PilZ domain-containing protein [Acidobacteriota bacterium]
MSVLGNLLARLRKPRGERRAAPRYGTHLENRLTVHVHLADSKLERPRDQRAPQHLVGYTRDVSESGLGVVLPDVRIAGRAVVGRDRTLRVQLGLPGRVVEMSAVAVRQAPLEGGEAGHLVGMQIQEMSHDDRAYYTKFLRSLALPDF